MIASESGRVSDLGQRWAWGENLPYALSPYTYRRRETRVVMVGDVGVGGDHPIRVQSMTTTRTLDTEATVAQAERLARVGCEIVRITAPTTKDARNLGEIKKRLRSKGITVPLVADIHFSPDAALEAADHVEKVRINPGNYADGRKFAVRSYTDSEYEAELSRIEERFAPLVLKCRANGVAMRIGTNHGSLSDRIVNRFGDTPEGMVESALEFVRICEKYGYQDVILSMKASNPKVMIAAYRLLAARMAEVGMTYPFHLGVTEAGNGLDGRIKSVIGIGSLLADGIGDTIRVSLTEEPEEEIPVAFRIANHFTPREESDRRAGRGAEPESTTFDERFRSSAVSDGSRSSALTGGSRDGEAERGGDGKGEPARQAAPRFDGEASAEVGSPETPIPWDAYHYARRDSQAMSVGPVTLGGGHVVAVVARVGSSDAAERGLRWASPGARRLARPDIVEWPVPDGVALDRFHDFLAYLGRVRELQILTSSGATLPKLGFLASGADVALLTEALSSADGVLLQNATPEATDRLARAVAPTGKALWLETRVDAGAPLSSAVQRVLATREAALAAGQADVVLAITVPTGESLIHVQRLLAAELARIRADNPLFLRSEPSEEHLLDAALPIGSLICDGLGDAVQAAALDGGQEEVQLSLDVLQAAGTRLSKTDYVACPSCGRTLFDLQSTTERIKTRTSHLVGVKIAIMGCVVNGPGEMADADFGYVGGSPGHVNLYVGKTCVERNVPADVADERLIALIKSKDRWQEPEPVEG